MTEAEWLRGPTLARLQRFILRGGGDKRRLLLVMCACVRDHWDAASEAARQTVLVAEARADGARSKSALYLAREAVTRELREGPQSDKGRMVAMQALGLANPNVQGALHGVLWQGITFGADAVEKRRVGVILDVYGNPFSPATFAPEWRTGTAVAIARGMYAAHNFDAMPILADALQDAGCDNENLLAHCREEKQAHVRGCWAVDLILGKE